MRDSGLAPIRLDKLLQQRARSGVRIYILAWNETKLAFAFNNQNAQVYLESLHPNISVLCHPTTQPGTLTRSQVI